MRLHALSVVLATLHGAMLVQSVPSCTTGGNWKTLAPIPLYPRQEHTTLAVNSTTLAIIGGILPNFTTTGLFQTYDISSNTWSPTPLPPLPLPLNHPNAAVVNNKLYLLGGLYDSGDLVWRGTGRSFVFDFAINAWGELPSMAEWDVPRGSAAMGVDDKTGMVYLAGGLTQLPLVDGLGVQQSVDVVSAFDTRKGVWVRLDKDKAGTMPGRRDHAGSAVVDGVMYVLGGRDTGVENVRGDIFALDLRGLEKGWVTKMGKMPTPRGGVSAGVVGGKVYVFGGEGNPIEGSDGVFDQVEAYDTKNDSWESVGTMKVPRHGTSAAVVKGGVYIPGGGIKQGGAPVDTFDVFYP